MIEDEEDENEKEEEELKGKKCKQGQIYQGGDGTLAGGGAVGRRGRGRR